MTDVSWQVVEAGLLHLLRRSDATVGLFLKKLTLTPTSGNPNSEIRPRNELNACGFLEVLDVSLMILTTNLQFREHVSWTRGSEIPIPGGPLPLFCVKVTYNTARAQSPL